MGTKDKLVERFKRLPKDFTYDETVRLFAIFGFKESTKGKTSGSRIIFVNEDAGMEFLLHKPHPGKIMKTATMRSLKNFLETNELI